VIEAIYGYIELDDPDRELSGDELIRWLSSYAGQSWLNDHHRPPQFQGGLWATIKEDATCQENKREHRGCIMSPFRWNPDKGWIYKHNDSYLADGDEDDYELPKLTDEIISWPHP
jgi:hypothetical protein